MSNIFNSYSNNHFCKTLEKCIESNKPGANFLQSIDDFIDDDGDPNLCFSKFQMGEHVYQNVRLFQIAYLYWKDPEKKWNTTFNKRFKDTVSQLLKDKRTKVYKKFTEYSLSKGEHFLKENSHAKTLSRKVNGYLLEEATLAHYAMAIGDEKMVTKVLKKDPTLLNSTCSLVKGKNLAHDKEVASVTFLVGSKEKKYKAKSKEFSEKVKKHLTLSDSKKVGEFARVTLSVQVQKAYKHSIKRITGVSLLHLAARMGHLPACTFLRESHANFIARDSKSKHPIDYLELSISQQVITKDKNTKSLRQVLNPLKQIGASLVKEDALLLKREGYWQLFDTSKKVTICAYEYLTKDSLEKNTKRQTNFKRDTHVSKKEHGANGDYTRSGFERGHVVAAENAVFSEQTMKATFLYTNAFPQDPNLNKGYWKKLETHIRNLVKHKGYIIELFTGCLFDQTYNDETIGKGEIAIPTHAFKVLHLHKGAKTTIKAYVVPNEALQPSCQLDTFLKTVKKVQKLSGIRFDKWV